ncbi:deoxyribodipyrimidine photo-lyase [Rhizobium beringeri]
MEALDGSLREQQGRLVLASGEALEVLCAFIRESGAEAVFWNRRYDPAGISIDAHIKHELEKQAIEARSFGGQLLHEPSRLMTGNGTPYRVYTPFWRALEGCGEPEQPLEAPAKLRIASQLPKSEALESWKLLPTKPDWAVDFTDLWTPGEDGAHEKLRAFIEDVLDGYKENRDYPARPATSLLSPHLAFGEISLPASGMPHAACRNGWQRPMSCIFARRSPGANSPIIYSSTSRVLPRTTGTSVSTASNGATTTTISRRGAAV